MPADLADDSRAIAAEGSAVSRGVVLCPSASHGKVSWIRASATQWQRGSSNPLFGSV